MNTENNKGWICAKCGKSLNPTVQECPCTAGLQPPILPQPITIQPPNPNVAPVYPWNPPIIPWTPSYPYTIWSSSGSHATVTQVTQ